MTNKYLDNKNNNKENRNNKNQNIYRNNGELVNKNSYMIYELNNTFKDKDKDVLNVNENNPVNKPVK